jgi:glutamate-ammonia-ligase adenylyltransferase
LPTQDEDLAWIATTLKLESVPQLLDQLDAQRELVAQEFDKLLGGAEPECKGCQGGKTAPVVTVIDDLLPQLGELYRQRLESWREHPRVLALRDEARARLMRLLTRTAQWVREDRVTRPPPWVWSTGWSRCCAAKVTWRCCWSAPMCMSACCACLGQHVGRRATCCCILGVIDELAASNMLHERFDATLLSMNWSTDAARCKAPVRTTTRRC